MLKYVQGNRENLVIPRNINLSRASAISRATTSVTSFRSSRSHGICVFFQKFPCKTRTSPKLNSLRSRSVSRARPASLPRATRQQVGTRYLFSPRDELLPGWTLTEERASCSRGWFPGNASPHWRASRSADGWSWLLFTPVPEMESPASCGRAETESGTGKRDEVEAIWSNARPR